MWSFAYSTFGSPNLTCDTINGGEHCIDVDQRWGTLVILQNKPSSNLAKSPLVILSLIHYQVEHSLPSLFHNMLFFAKTIVGKTHLKQMFVCWVNCLVYSFDHNTCH